MNSASKCFALLVLPLLIPALGAATVLEVDLGATPGNESYNELRQPVALLAGGSFASVWTERIGLPEVHMQWVRPDGSRVFANGGRVLTSPGESEGSAVVTGNPAGGAFVALSRQNPEGARIFVHAFDAAGNPRWSAGGVFAATAAYRDEQIEPQLSPAPQGGVDLCFQVFHPIGDAGSEIVCQRFGADGRRLWTDQGVKAGGRPGYRVLPRIVRDARNGLMVFWRNDRMGLLTPKDRVLIEGQHLAPDGTRSWGSRGLIVRATNLPAGTGHLYSSLGAVSDGQGGAVVSTDDGPAGTNLDVFAQRVTGDGRLLWRNGIAVATGAAYQQHDSATAAPDGGAFVTVWLPQSLQLRLYRIDGNGKVRWSQLLSSTDSEGSPSDFNAYGSFDDGRLRVAWIHQRQNGAFTMDVYLAVFDLAGRRLNGPAATPITTAQDGQFLRGFVFDPARKQGFAVWNDRRSGTWDDLDTVGGLYKE